MDLYMNGGLSGQKSKNAFFPGYTFEKGKSVYRGEEVGEGGYVYAEPGIYTNKEMKCACDSFERSVMEDKIDYTKYFKSLENYSYKRPTVAAEYVWNTNTGAFTFRPTTVTPKITIAAKKVIFNPPATVIIWEDGDKTVVKCSKNESFDPEKGIAMCMLKKLLTQDGYNKMRKEASNWIKERQVVDES